MHFAKWAKPKVLINARRPAELGSHGLSKLARLREVAKPRQLLKTPRVFAPKSLSFPVGTLISERPPDSSEQAQFGHSAPTLGV